MFLVAIAWIYVVLMVAVVEATSPQGTVLGASRSAKDTDRVTFLIQ